MTTETLHQDFTLKELRALYDLVGSLQTAHGRDGVITAFLERLDGIVPFDSCSILLPNDLRPGFEITHAAGEHAASLVGRKVVSGEGISGWVVANRHPLCNTDPQLDLSPTLARKFKDYRTLAVFPLLKDDGVYGAIALYSSSQKRYDETQQKLLAEASGLLALALSAELRPASVEDFATSSPEVYELPVSTPLNNTPLHPMRIQAFEFTH